MSTPRALPSAPTAQTSPLLSIFPATKRLSGSASKAASRSRRNAPFGLRRSRQEITLDTSPEEMADGDPQMAECLWRSTLSRGPSRHGRCRRGALRCLVLSVPRGSRTGCRHRRDINCVPLKCGALPGAAFWCVCSIMFCYGLATAGPIRPVVGGLPRLSMGVCIGSGYPSMSTPRALPSAPTAQTSPLLSIFPATKRLSGSASKAASRSRRNAPFGLRRSRQEITLDTSPEEMADGDPQMAECLWRSTLSRGPSRHGRCRRGALRCLVLSVRASQ